MRRQQTRFERLMRIRQMNTENVINILRSKNLLLSYLECEACMLPMVERSRKVLDGVCWVCTNANCYKFRTTKSIRTNSFFDKFRISLSDIFSVVILWSEGKNFSSIISNYGYTKEVLSRIILKIRKIIKIYYDTEQIRLGGPGIVCQIDESQFVHKVKHNRGRAPSSDIWVFGIADTSYSPSGCYMEIVPDRKAETLLPIIRKVCKSGTIIHSDCWKAYLNIERDLGFSHNTVKHKLYFVDPNSGVHTQNIESFWNKMKRVTKSMNGISKIRLPGLLSELMFKDEFKSNILSSFMFLIAV